MIPVIPIFFTYFVLISASSRTNEIGKPTRERSSTETIFNRYPKKAEAIPILKCKVMRDDDGLCSSLEAYNQRIIFSPKYMARRTSPIADPEFLSRYFGEKNLDNDFPTAAEDKKGNGDSGDENMESKGGKEDEVETLFFDMDDLQN
jgi:hypothetical protein